MCRHGMVQIQHYFNKRAKGLLMGKLFKDKLKNHITKFAKFTFCVMNTIRGEI